MSKAYGLIRNKDDRQQCCDPRCQRLVDFAVSNKDHGVRRECCTMHLSRTCRQVMGLCRDRHVSIKALSI